MFISLFPIKAPECFTKRAYSEKTDVWAFGITMIEIFTRKAVYQDHQMFEIVLMISNQQMNPSYQLPEWLNAEVRQFLANKCFAYDPNERATFKVKQISIEKTNKLIKNIPKLKNNKGNCRIL